VTINGWTATTSAWSASLITATVPSSFTTATTGPVKVTVGGVASNTTINFTVLAPVITGISPSGGPAGTQVQVAGSGFGSTQGTSIFSFNGTTGNVVTWSDTLITVTVPASATAGRVWVAQGSLFSNTNLNFTVPDPKIVSLVPTTGVVGTQVTINGSGFRSSQGSNSVTFNNNTASIVSWSDTQIVATVPASAKTGPVTITGSNQDVVFTLPSPVVTSLSPSTGPNGTSVQIIGSGFGASQGSSTVTFNGVAATATAWSDTSITAAVPSTATSGVVVVKVGGISSVSNTSFSVPPPHVSSVTPNVGTAGTQITVTGSGFHATQGPGNVVFNNNTTATIISWSDTQIVATVPVGASTGAMTVWQNVYGNSDVAFSLISPRITGLVPASGPVGTQVQINGSGFGATQGGSSVQISGVVATVVSWSDNQIVATVPAASHSGAIAVFVAGISSNNNITFTVPTPRITGISPTSGVAGTTVTINGSGFQPARGGGAVYLTSSVSPNVFTSWSDTQIVFAIPAGAVSGAVKVVANNGDASNQDLAFTMPNPIVTGLVPASGLTGTQVQVNGTGFGATQGSSSVTFNNVAASVVSWSNTQITAVVPATAISGPVQVTEGGVSGNASVYFNIPAPKITGFSPTIGGVGNPVTITGTGFQSTQGSSSYVTFSGGASQAAIKTWSDTQIVALVPPSTTTGFLDVAVNTIPSNYVNYTIPSQTISTITPTTGPVGTQVTLTGTAFGSSQGTSVLSFNGQPAASITSWTNTQIVGTVPVTAATGPAVVTIGGVNSNTTLFTVPPPHVNNFLPTGGASGTQVTVNGTGFQANQRDSTITFNGIAATVSSWSDTQIVATVPASATTGPLLVNVNTVPSQNVSFEVPHPSITSISPPEAPANGVITITGSGFGASDRYSPDGVSITFVGFINVNGVTVGALSWSDTSITTRIPSNSTSGPVTVSKYNATSNGVQLTVEGAPTVTGLAPSVGPVGASVIISGSGFGATQSTSTVQFNGVPATVSSWGDTQITAVVPPGTATGPVSVAVATVSGPTSTFTVNTTVQITDSQGHSSSYTSAMIGGAWVGTDATGSGCTSCTIRGTIHDDYDPSTGNLTAHTDELGRITNNAYDADSNVTSTTAHLDANTPVQTTYTYNSFGEPLTVTDLLGNVTTNTYDPNGNLLTVTSPKPDAPTAASVTHFAYDTKGQLTQITDPLNHITTLAYYPTGLIHTITDAQSNVTSYEYDLRGNRTSVLDAANGLTKFDYDLGNRLKKITYPDTTFVSFAYDSRGRRTSVTDQNGKVTSYAYDDADRLTSVTDAALNVTHYAYDLENNLTSITDAAQHTTSFVYDAFGRVTQTAFPSSLNENYGYDAVGNLTSKVDRKNQTILYVYDALNRLTHKGYPDATGVDYVYDLAGKIHQVTDPTGTYGFAYDNMGRMVGTTTQYSFLPGITYSNAYGYDAASKRTQFTAPDGSTNTYGYDTLNRLTALTDSGAGQFTMGYDALSRRTQLTRPNGVTTSYTYDPVSHLQSILHKLGVNTLDGATYAYDAAGNRTSKTNQLNSALSTYGYDNIYQLTGVTQGATSTEAYSFDPVGNRLSSLSVPSYSYNSSNEITATGSSSSYTYDDNGNTLTKTDSTGTTTYTWDFENRLTSVHPPNQTTVTFKYDPFGRRIQKGGSVYVYSGANLIEESDSAGNLAARYVFGSGIDEPLAAYRGATWKFYQADGLGSITSLSTSTGGVSDTFVYDSYGNVTSSTGSFSQPFRYTGREWDTETGLYFYRARYYDATAGRFLSEDPLAGLGSRYAYVANNPISLVDRFGLSYQVAQSENTITVSADVILFGPGATSELAGAWQAYANLVWNGTGQTSMGCKVVFKIQMRADPTHTLPPVRDGVSGTNAVYIPDPESGYFRSFVNEVGGWAGAWSAEANGETVSHEIGHFFGLPDYYNDYWHGIRVPRGWGDYSVPMAGHENDIMADSQNGWPQQAEIDQIVKSKAKACACPRK
jgi:RHS repeat-associated protein